MKHSFALAFLLSTFALTSTIFAASTETKTRCVYSGTDGNCVEPALSSSQQLVITVFGQGVAPTVTSSPAQAYALAKRAALADGYRQIAERIQGVHVEGYDSVKNMMLQRSNVRTSVDAMVRGANTLDTTFREGLCEVELEVVIAYSQLTN